MQFRYVRAAARLLLVTILMIGTVISGIVPTGDPAGSPSDAAALMAKNKHATNQGKPPASNTQQNNTKKNGQNAKQQSNPKSKSKNTKPGENTGKNNGKSKQRRGKTASGSLDADQIAAENAETVAALKCSGDLTSIRVDGSVFCTHGDDPERAFAAAESGDEVRGANGGQSQSRVACVGDGVYGPRVQLVYVHSGRGLSNQIASTVRRLATEMDAIFDQSARKTGGSLHVRYVTDPNCQVNIQQLQASTAAINSFGTMIQAMQAAGFDDLDRKYLMLVDANVYCGIGTFAGGTGADSPSTQAHDFTGYARVDLPCWDSGTMAHELSHNLGAVQNSAPHTSRAAHCIDEWDVMCYSDPPDFPQVEIVCPDETYDVTIFDCNNDDYFHTNPPAGSYLDTHWNTADSRFLIVG
ncbi:MAG: hypothetical protein H0T18_04815, partial [Chloroflexia bacterium]|nr:hypothetical protein [Chloroflexia bacterium]